MKKKSLYKPLVLTILDGWGLSTSYSGNFISTANPKNFNYFWKNYPHLILNSYSDLASESRVVPEKNLAHTIIGAGRTIWPKSKLISYQIKNGSFFENEKLREVANESFQNKSSIHLIGLVSEAGFISEFNHLVGLLLFLKNFSIKNVYIHAILDGIDTKQNEAIGIIDQLEQKIAQIGIGQIATISGRSWVFEEEARAENQQAFINSLIYANTKEYQDSSIDGIKKAYSQRTPDDEIAPFMPTSSDPQNSRIKPADIIFFFDFSSYGKSNLIDSLYSNFKNMYSLCDYKNYKTKHIFDDYSYENTLSEVISKADLKHKKISEGIVKDEITYFFNGKRDKKFQGESVKIFESLSKNQPRKDPQMQLYEIVNAAKISIKNGLNDLIILNIPNLKIMTKTGDLQACQKTIQFTDTAIAEIVQATLQKSGCAIITADHGAAEDMGNISRFTGQYKNFHTLNPVPFIYINPDNKIDKPDIFYKVESGSQISEFVKSQNNIADISPTILDILGVSKPIEMLGKSLLPNITKS